MINLKLNDNIKKISKCFKLNKTTATAFAIGIVLPVIMTASIEGTNKYPVKEQSKIVETINTNNQEQSDNLIVEEDTRLPVALTFDDGPSKHTTKLLNLLDEYNIKATFFVIGRNIEGNEEALIDAYQRGHEIAIHTYNHKDLTTLSLEEVEKEIELTKEKIMELGITPSNLVRPPYGRVSQEILNNIDYPFVAWSVDVEDWKTSRPWNVRKKILNTIDENEIMLLHDGKTSTIEGLENVLTLIADEYRFITVSDLFEENEVEIETGKKYRKIK